MKTNLKKLILLIAAIGAFATLAYLSKNDIKIELFNPDINVTKSQLLNNGFVYNEDLLSYTKKIDDSLVVHYVFNNDDPAIVSYFVSTKMDSISFVNMIDKYNVTIASEWVYDPVKNCNGFSIVNNNNGKRFDCCYSKGLINIRYRLSGI